MMSIKITVYSVYGEPQHTVELRRTQKRITVLYKYCIYIYIWRFPKIRVPPVLIHFNGIFHDINHPAIWGTPMETLTSPGEDAPPYDDPPAPGSWHVAGPGVAGSRTSSPRPPDGRGYHGVPWGTMALESWENE